MVAVVFAAGCINGAIGESPRRQETPPRAPETFPLSILQSPEDSRSAAIACPKLPGIIGVHTELADCRREGVASVRNTDNGGMERKSLLLHVPTGNRCELTEVFTPTANSIRWEIEIRGVGDAGQDKPWMTAIVSGLEWPDRDAEFWAAWGDNRPDAPANSSSWTDPLMPRQLADMSFAYGGRHFGQPQAISLPLVTVLSKGAGASLILSPEDLILDMALDVSAKGAMRFTRTKHRIEPGGTVKFAMDVVAHPPCWRGGLAWIVNRYPDYFNPPNPRTYDVAGCGSYSSHAEDFDADALMRMAYRVNWKASFDFPFMGMFIPPVSGDDDEWTDFKGQKTSIRRMRDHSRWMRGMGFHVLNYFNVTEFGAYIKHPPPPRKAQSDADLWKDANDFLYGRLSEAILRGKDGKPIGSWEGCVAMDPGEPVYREFLFAQARRHVEAFPESSGICIDRMDWLQFYNDRRDDGVSWVNDKPARSLVVSWHDTMAGLGPIMHDAGKVIYCNPHYRRLDLMRQTDGVYDEFGQMGHSMNLCALLCLRKPVIEWTVPVPELQKTPDDYFQRHLHMGAFLTAPIPGNDHTILPDGKVEKFYFDYGPMLESLRGRKWVLQPGVIEVADGKAKANIFEIPGGWIVPVTFAAGLEKVRVVIRGMDIHPVNLAVHAIHPGENEWTAIEARGKGDAMEIDVPVSRGCAMVRIVSAWMEPQLRSFTTSVDVRLNTALRDAAIRYTLDGSEPTAKSKRYEGPVRLDASATVSMAVFAGRERAGDVIRREFVKVPPPAPEISPSGAVFDETVKVALSVVTGSSDAALRFTVDGTEPNERSPIYREPVPLSENAEVRARVIAPGALLGKVATARFMRRGPVPPSPDVPLNDLKPIKATVGYFETAKVNLSTQGKPLALAGKVYQRGMGVHANSELAYEFRPEYGAFVAIVGVDDEMKDFSPASVVFRVLADENVLHESPVMRPGQVWHINVPLPAEYRLIRLLADDAGDGINGDHGDWAEAGFILKKP